MVEAWWRAGDLVVEAWWRAGDLVVEAWWRAGDLVVVTWIVCGGERGRRGNVALEVVRIRIGTIAFSKVSGGEGYS